MYPESTYWAKTRLSISVCLVLLITGCADIERRVLYSPKSCCKFWDPPAACETYGLNIQDVFFCSEDGVRLHGWLVSPTDTTPTNYVLFSHGRSGNISSFKTPLLKFVRSHKVTVFAYDYRGYGKSQGEPTEEGLYLDAKAASNWLCDHANLQPAEIIVMGRSLGAAVAIELASRDEAKALIVESGFTSVPDLVQDYSQGLFTGRNLKSKFDSRDKIGSYRGPILISHGIDDKMIPFHHGVDLAKATTTGTTQFVEVAGGHKPKPSPFYDQQLEEFLNDLPACKTLNY